MREMMGVAVNTLNIINMMLFSTLYSMYDCPYILIFLLMLNIQYSYQSKISKPLQQIKNISTTTNNMQKRLTELSESFDHLKFDQCLRQSDQIIKKLQKSTSSTSQKEKKKNTLDEHNIQNLYMIRIGSLAALGYLAQANQLLRIKFKNGVCSQDGSFLFLQICVMVMDRNIPEYVRGVCQYKEKEKKNVDINRFMLLTHNYSQLSRIFLKKYATQKKLPDSFAQIYLQYLQQLHNTNTLNYTLDRIYKPNPKIDLKFISIFFQKFISTFNTQQQQKQQNNNKNRDEFYNTLKIKNAIKDFKIRIAVNQGKCQIVRELVKEAGEDVGVGGRGGEGVGDMCVYLRSLREMEVGNGDNQVVWRREFLRIFQNNLNLDNYQPVYDYSIQFISSLISSQPLPQNYPPKPQKLPFQQLYTYQQSQKSQLTHHLDSLYTEYNLLKQNQQQNRKKDYYKISLKNCLLLILYTLNSIRKKNRNKDIIPLLHEYLIIYRDQYGKKLTFPDQIREYFVDLEIVGGGFKEKYGEGVGGGDGEEDMLIWRINCQRLYVKDPVGRDLRDNVKQWNRLHTLYKENMITVQKQRKLQKGQRYLSDQFLSIEADSIRRYIQNTPQIYKSASTLTSIVQLILSHLQPSISSSPSNHDLKLRTIYFLHLLNYNQQCLPILQSLDIKASQYQTLGYIFYKILSPSLNPQNISSYTEQLLKKQIRSYQQVWKQTIEYAYKSILGISFHSCEEYLCYYHNIRNSYCFVMLLYVLYLRNRGKVSSVYYLREMLERIGEVGKEGKELSFNADGDVFRNLGVFGVECEGFGEFYGVYNNVDVLELECKIKLLLWQGVKQVDKPQTKTQQKAQQKVQQKTQQPIPPSSTTTTQIQKIKSQIKQTLRTQNSFNFNKYKRIHNKINYTYKGNKYNQVIVELEMKLIGIIYEIVIDVCGMLGKEEGKEGKEKEEGLGNLESGLGRLTDLLNGVGFLEQVRLIPQARGHILQIISVLNHHIQQLSSSQSKKKKPQQQTLKQTLTTTISLLISSITDKLTLHHPTTTTNTNTDTNIKTQQPILQQYFSQNKQLKVYKQVCEHRNEMLRRMIVMSGGEFKKIYRIK